MFAVILRALEKQKEKERRSKNGGKDVLTNYLNVLYQFNIFAPIR